MTIQQKIRMTVPAFLEWADGRPGRYELVDGEPVRMAPERARHNRVKYLVCRALDDAVRAAGLACDVFTDGMTVEIDAHTCYEPDAAVQCGVEQDPDAMILAAPCIVVEVASPTTETLDATTKLLDYFKVASIEHYLIVQPDRRAVIHHRRDRGAMRTTIATAGTIRLDPPGLTLQSDSLWPSAG